MNKKNRIEYTVTINYENWNGNIGLDFTKDNVEDAKEEAINYINEVMKNETQNENNYWTRDRKRLQEELDNILKELGEDK